MYLKKALLSLSAAGMVLAPVAAQAGTTAAASVGNLSSLSGVGERQSTAVKKKNGADSGTVILAVVGAAAIGGGIYALVDKKDKSNGS
ncbi:hypothetical protein [Novosphingobium resinovorum]|uniref:hypothetical protein n=1 Tax=Novosphingobium resinovorum TaxID=158500 RepID=UPI002ED1227E|nr:hypothetical protein [Novosphingobium resinovorum]